MATNADAEDIRIPAIAIHGVGKHKPGCIEKRLNENVGDNPDFHLSVSEFNWDQYVDHGAWDSPRSAVWNLQKVSSNLHATATVGLSIFQPGLDARLSNAQLKCCNLLRHLIAAVLTAVVAIPAIVIVVFLPIKLVQIGPVFPMNELRWFANWFIPLLFYLLSFMLLSIILLGLARSFIQRSLSPIKSSVTCVLLTCLSPFLAILSIPLSVNWASVGLIVGFFCILGVFVSIVELLLPNAPAYTAWRDFVVAPYLLVIFGGLLGLQALCFLFGQIWYEGPIKVLLDIARYVGEPRYREKTLLKLEGFIRDKQASSDSLVIVGHSLGSVIALDYLRNWCEADPNRRVWLITLGSPYRRFFLSWLPGILFDQSTNQTAVSINEKFHTFRWLNIFRPWDYIGKSLQLEAHTAGLDRSTGQYRRIDGHSDYWSDDIVLATIKAALTSVPQPSPRATVPSRRYLPKAIELTRPPKKSLITSKLALSLMGLGIVWMTYSFVNRNAELARTRAAIAERGIRLEILVSHRIIPDVAGQHMYAHEFEFVGEGLKMSPYQVSPYLPASTAQQRFDYRELEAYVRRNCVLEREAKWYTSERSIICTSREPIEMAYLPPGSSNQFYLPAFESKFYFRDLAGWLIYPLCLFVLLSIPALPFVMLTSASYSVFLGREPGDADMERLDGVV